VPPRTVRTPAKKSAEAELADFVSGGPTLSAPQNDSPTELPLAPAPAVAVDELLAPPPPEVAPEALPPVLTRDHPLTTGAHPLDSAPLNSKIVLVDDPHQPRRIAVFARPDAAPVIIPRPNPVYALPTGAKLHKRGPRQFLGQLPMPDGSEALFQEDSTLKLLAEMSHTVHDREIG
jgi:hypothetical protein